MARRVHRRSRSTGRINLLVRIGHGSVTVTARDDIDRGDRPLTPRDARSDLLERTAVEMRGPTLAVMAPRQGGIADALVGWRRDRDRIDAEIVVPTGTATKITTASADITVKGRIGGADLVTGLGHDRRRHRRRRPAASLRQRDEHACRPSPARRPCAPARATPPSARSAAACRPASAAATSRSRSRTATSARGPDPATRASAWRTATSISRPARAAVTHRAARRHLGPARGHHRIRAGAVRAADRTGHRATAGSRSRSRRAPAAATCACSARPESDWSCSLPARCGSAPRRGQVINSPASRA